MPESEPDRSELTFPRYGSYQVLNPIGAGGMSSVYRAVHVETGHEVALKVLPGHLAKNPIALQRFNSEARNAESLQHPNIVAIYDRGVDQGRNYLVLEFVAGMDLHAYVQLRGPRSVSEAVRVVRQVAEGLRYANERGVVHRDIKPSNILRGLDGEIKIADLGLALQWEFEDERVTREGTTVGTVDYMAPEQARDSRAAGPRSDLYSLGCTFYYLLTGIPPYPGGDITDKLTRHVQAKPPDVRDLRPDVPEALSQLMIKMMAKRPEDRHTSFNELIAALDAIPLEPDEEATIALAPLGDHGNDVHFNPNESTASASRPPSSIPEISLASLPPEELEPIFRPAPDTGQARPVLPGGRSLLAGPSTSVDGHALPSHEVAPQRSSMSAVAWVSLCVLLGLGVLITVIVVDRIVRPPDTLPPLSTMVSRVRPPEPPAPVEEPSEAPGPVPETIPDQVAAIARPALEPTPTRSPNASEPKSSRLAEVWVEPADTERAVSITETFSEELLRTYLPARAITPISGSELAPVNVVRRVPGSGEHGFRAAIDEGRGTVELADEGPFPLNDLRIPGESRVIRARQGSRSILRLDRPSLEVVRSLPGVFVLEGKSLVLESLDLIVNVRDLSSSQTCLFSCNGSSLTLRDCTITLINELNQPFSLVRAGGSDARGSRVRFENTLVRGSLSSVFELGPGSADLVIRDSLVLGSHGPVIRVTRGGPAVEHRVSIMDSMTGSLGPLIEWNEGEGASTQSSRPVIARVFRSVIGRFQGAGIASVIACRLGVSKPGEHIDWHGDRNLYTGWKGHFAVGGEPTLVVSGLSEVRSTWNGSDHGSQAIPIAWPWPRYLTQTEPRDWMPFVPGWEGMLERVARPRPFLGEKTFWSFSPHPVPLPVISASASAQPIGPAPSALLLKDLRPREAALKTGLDPRRSVVTDEGTELFFDANSAEWRGDLGAFLRDRVRGQVKHVRVVVRGSGPRSMSPVRFPDGATVEIRVEPPVRQVDQWLSWSAEPESRAPALLELKGGTLLLSQLHLRDHPGANVGSLVKVEQGDLILHRCRLTGTPGNAAGTPTLVDYSAASTQPRRLPPPGVFVTPPDRPVCLIEDSTLIGAGTALRAELGVGLVAVSQTAFATSGDTIQLVPARVSRSRFDAELVFHHSTLASETNLVRLEGWLGASSGPDRPWLVSSERTAFLDNYDRRASDTVLLRSDPEALSGGVVFWQGLGDAVDVDRFAVPGDEPPSGRVRDVVLQWVNLWGGNHQREITGPRAGSNLPSVRLLDRLKVGHVEPSDLWLDLDYHPGRSVLNVGADLSRQGISPRLNAGARRR